MFKMLFLSLFLWTATLDFSALRVAGGCDCTVVSNVHKTGETSGTFSFAWDASTGATGYEVRYVRHDDNYARPVVFTSNTAHTFTELSAGTYTFYVAAICGSEGSGWVGIAEVIIQ
jgi:hypothetical protein